MNYSQEEDHIIAHLNTKFADDALAKGYNPDLIDISPLPETDEGFEKSFAKRKLFVCYTGEEAENQSTSLSAVSQEANALFGVLIKSKSLRDAGVLPGVYSLITLLKKFLVGFRLLQGEPLVYMDTKMENRDSGTFAYLVTFRSKIQVIQDLEEEETDIGALLKKVNYIP